MPDAGEAPLIHFSREPLESVYSTPDQYVLRDKPIGLWVSMGDSWPEYSLPAFGNDHLKHATEVVLDPGAKILRIGDLASFERFEEDFGLREGLFSIRWRDVAALYQGIIIDPYFWRRRNWQNSRWYYTWDCASGCIWDAHAIASLRPIRSHSDKIGLAYPLIMRILNP